MNATTSTRTHSFGQRSVVFAALLALLSWSFIVASPTTADALDPEDVPEDTLVFHMQFIDADDPDMDPIVEDRTLESEQPIGDVGFGLSSNHPGYLPDFTVAQIHVSCSEAIWDNPVDADGESVPDENHSDFVGYGSTSGSPFFEGQDGENMLIAPTEVNGETVAAWFVVNKTFGENNPAREGCGQLPPPDPDPDPGSLTVSKVVTADEGAEAGESFDFNVTCDDGTDEDFTLPENDTWSWGPEDFEADTECTITEEDADGDPEISIAVTPEGAVEDSTDSSVTVTIGEDVDVTVDFTNHYPFEPDPEISVSLDKQNRPATATEFADDSFAEEPGESVEFELTITNTSDEIIVLDTLVDTVGTESFDLFDADEDGVRDNGCLAHAGDELAAGTSITCTFWVDDYAPDHGASLTNTARVDVSHVEREDITDWDEDSSTVRTPLEPGQIGISLDKQNRPEGAEEFADESVADAPGDDVEFHLDITNPSDVTVVIDELTDSFDGIVVDLLAGEVLEGTASLVDNTCATLGGTLLAPGASTDCTFTLEGYAPDSGESLTNTAEVEVSDEGDPDRTARADDDSTVTTDDELVEPVGIVADITKLNDADGDGQFADEGFAEDEGDAVDFQLEIFNDNPVDVVIVELTDSYDGVVIDLLAGDVLEGEATLTNNTCSDLETIPANDSVTCTFTLEGYAPAEGGDVTNVAFVELEDPETGERADADDPSVVETVEEGILPGELEPGISLVKEADVTEAEVGDVITYTYTVTNTGDTTLTDITLDDDVLGEIELESTTLEPGQSTTGTATHTVTEDDLDEGEVHNVAIVTGWPPEGEAVTDTDDETVVVPAPDVEEAVLADEQLPVTGFDTLQALFAALLALSLGGVTLLGLRLHELRGRMYGTA